jgi:hypothetical protein
MSEQKVYGRASILQPGDTLEKWPLEYWQAAEPHF